MNVNSPKPVYKEVRSRSDDSLNRISHVKFANLQLTETAGATC